MGTIVRFARPRPLIRQPQAQIAIERESREARRSLFILMGAFLVTAIVICAAVVAMVATTWREVLIMAAFVLVFALTKIILADALIYAMLRYDAASAEAPLPAGPVGGYRKSRSIRQPPAVNRRTQSLKPNKPRVATGNSQPGGL
jgi:hypothetical protein